MIAPSIMPTDKPTIPHVNIGEETTKSTFETDSPSDEITTTENPSIDITNEPQQDSNVLSSFTADNPVS